MVPVEPMRPGFPNTYQLIANLHGPGPLGLLNKIHPV